MTRILRYFCERCEDTGTVPIPGRPDYVARCPECKGSSVVLGASEEYGNPRWTTWLVIATGIILGLAIGFQF